MKIAIINDLHLNKSIYKVMDKEIPTLPFRNVDFMRSFEWMVNQCISDIKPDLLVIGGDVYDHYNVSDCIRGFFSNQLSKLTNNKIPVIILTGNHDVLIKTHTLQDIKELNLKSVKVIDQSCIMDFKDIRLLLMPYSMDIEQKKISIRDEFRRFLKEIQDKKSDKSSIFFGHFGVKGAVLNQYAVDGSTDLKELNLETTTTTTLIENDETDRKDFYSRRSEDIDAEWLDELGVEYVFLGDFHRHQKIDKIKTKAFYTGSIEKTDINELKQKKGFMVYDSDAEEVKDYGKSRFIEYPYCRPMMEIKGNLSELKSKFNEIDCSKYQGAIVKLIFIGDKNELIDFSSGLDKLKKEISEKLNPVHLFHDQRPKRDKEEKMASEVEKEIMEKGHISNEDVLSVVKEMIIERIKDKEEQNKISELATEIYREVMGK